MDCKKSTFSARHNKHQKDGRGWRNVQRNVTALYGFEKLCPLIKELPAEPRMIKGLTGSSQLSSTPTHIRLLGIRSTDRQPDSPSRSAAAANRSFRQTTQISGLVSSITSKHQQKFQRKSLERKIVCIVDEPVCQPRLELA